MLSYPAAKTDHSAISSAFTQARSRAQNNFIGVWEIRSIQLLLNNKFLLLLGARSRVQTSLWRSSFGVSLFFVLLPSSYSYKPFVRWNFNSKFCNALWLLSFHLSFLVPFYSSREFEGWWSCSNETKHRWPDFLLFFFLVRDERREESVEEQNIYYSIRFRFFSISS